MDALFLALILVLFALCWGFVYLCDGLSGSER